MLTIYMRFSKKVAVTSLWVFLFIFIFASHSYAKELTAGRDYVRGEIIVKFKTGQDPATLQSQAEKRASRKASFTGIIKNAQENIGYVLSGRPAPEAVLEELQTVSDAGGIDTSIELSSEKNIFIYKGANELTVPELVSRYKGMAAVEYAEPNVLYHTLAIPNDTDFGKLWGMDKIKASAAWDRSTGGSTVKVAIVDTGVDKSHPDLAANVVETRAFADACSTGKDLVGHGTHVAGTIGGVGNNNAGVAGVNWKVSILAYCVNGAGGLPLSAVSSAIDAAVAAGAKVINLSLGGETTSPTMQTSIAAAVRAGTVVVASAGNSGGMTADQLYPARDPNVITVSATGPNDELAHYSSYGHAVDVSAPGGDPSGGSSTCTTQNCIYSTLPGGRYGNLAGTSMSAPHVTGLVALVFSVNPNLSPQQVQTILQETADDLGASGRDDKFGYGRINAQAAVERAALESGATAGPTQPPTGSGTLAPTSQPKTTQPPLIITLPPHQCPDQARTGDYNCDQKVSQTDMDKWTTDFNANNADLSFFELIRRGLNPSTSTRPAPAIVSPTP